MSDATYTRAHAAHTAGAGETLIYRALFAVLFVFSAFAAVISRLTGGETSTSVWQSAKQAAHATAGYAVKY